MSHGLQVETEVKLRITGDPGIVEENLLSHGFIKVDECVERDIYFKHPCRDLSLSDEAVRLRYRSCRNSGEHLVLTYKGPRISREGVLKARMEVEARLQPGEIHSMVKLLEYIGFPKLASFTKKRFIFHKDGLEATIDELMGVGFFLEVELKKPDAVKALQDLLRGLSNVTVMVKETYLEICLETGRCIDEQGSFPT
ncbi:class IV adenylate cyclase [Desulfurococcus mucosus]|uniref:class IV adenylate cyclase n=1 Tax=Desulfurococcus mucosus TaxID=2275 RepID=UPI000A94516D|nr:class IV adenylate cyclase [Desulfurococcus mucosus]